jgi:hypothetical protein
MAEKIREMRTRIVSLGSKKGDGASHGGIRTEIGEANEEIGDDEFGGAVETVVLFFDELEVVFEVGGAVGDSHEGHEGAAEEDAVDQGDECCSR